jgi:gamma-glutamyltranspeptidase/glutathione hydrolase
MGRFSQSTRALDVSGREHAGLLRAADLNGWRPPVEGALGVDHGGHRVFKCGPWSQGPALLQALSILEGFDLGALDPEGPQFVHLATEALKLALADRDAWYGDSPSTPIGALLSSAYAAERRALITARALARPAAGAPDGRSPPSPGLAARAPSGVAHVIGGGEPTFAREPRATRAPGAVDRAGPRQRGDTCHLDVVDRWGNMVSATPSGGWLQSSPVVPELGFALGTRLQMASLERGSPNALAPRKRPRTTLTPTMTFLEGRPHLAFGTPGGDQQEQWSLIMLLRHLHGGMSLQQAIDAPAFHTNDLTASFWPHGREPASLVMESRFPAETLSELRARGHALTVGGPWTEGRLCACLCDHNERPPLIRAGASARGGQAYAIVR